MIYLQAAQLLWKEWLVLLILTLVIDAQDSELYMEVDSRFPSDFSSCFLSSYNNGKNRIDCAISCIRHPDCHLFCMKGAECQLYKAHVSHHWSGIQSDPVPDMRCHSSWASAKDAIPDSTYTATPRWNGWDGSKENAVNGYACATDAGFSYSSSNITRPWWAANLGTIRRITSVRILTRSEKKHISRFENVEVRIGNSNSGNGDFSANTLLGFYEDLAPQREIIYFKTEVPIEGSVVSIQRIDSTERILIFADVQILYE